MNEQSLFNILSDETRRRLLGLLLKEGELCVCELHYALDMLQPKISRHLAAMREASLLWVNRDGTRIYYRLNTDMPLWAFKVLDAMAKAGKQPVLLQRDQQRLQRMPGRPERLAA